MLKVQRIENLLPTVMTYGEMGLGTWEDGSILCPVSTKSLCLDDWDGTLGKSPGFGVRQS